MSTFFIGLIIGIWIGAFVGIWVISMCHMAARGDQHIERMNHDVPKVR